MSPIAAFATALLVALVVSPLIARAAHRRGYANPPSEARHIHTRPVPRMGGIAVFAATLAGVMAALATPAAALGEANQRFFLAVLFGGTVLFCTGLVDDVRGLRASTKLGLQCVAAAAVYLIGVRIRVVSFGPTSLAVGWWSFPLTVLWLVGVTNAFNLIDGLDGLATGLGLVVLAAVGVSATLLHNADVVIVCAALLGALAGFLRYNLTPARLFLGDSGSLFVGFMLALLSVHGSLKSATTLLMSVPVFALSVPLLDVLLAVARRWLRGVPIFGADARHIHHRLLAAGLQPRAAAMTLCALTAALAAYGLGLAFAPPPAVLAVSLAGGSAALLVVLAGIRRLDYVEFAAAGSVIAAGVGRARRMIHEQIHARELAEQLRHAPSLEALNTALSARASQFGFLRIEVGSTAALDARKRGDRGDARSARVWTMDVPMAAPAAGLGGDEALCLRIWCDADRSDRSYGAERLVRLVAPAVEQGRWSSTPPASGDAVPERTEDAPRHGARAPWPGAAPGPSFTA